MSNAILGVDFTGVKARILASLPHSPDTARIAKGLGAAAMAKWKSLAQQRLRSSARDYIQGLELLDEDGKVIIALHGTLANMVENGFEGGDMREWLLSSPKAKEGKNGRYMAIPFRHGTPGTSGGNVGGVMPGPIHDAAKRLRAQLSRPGHPIKEHGGVTTIHGERLRPHKGMKQQAKDILHRKEKPWHSTSIYMGMIRKAKHIAGGTQTTGYSTFRTISEHTRDEGRHWVHPGIRPRHLASDVQKYLDKIAQGVIRTAMAGPKGPKGNGQPL